MNNCFIYLPTSWFYMRTLLFALFLFFSAVLWSQQGGDVSFEFLNLPVSAHATSLGGKIVTVKDDDLSLSYHNPAFVDSTVENKISCTFGSVFAAQTGISNGYAAYGKNVMGRPFVFSMAFLNYGNFDETNEIGHKTGSFTASDIVVSVATSQKVWKKVYAGASLKPVFSSIAGYSAKALFADVSLTYSDSLKGVNSSLVISNTGFVYDKFVKKVPMRIPFQLAFGYTKKFKHAPLRVSFALRDLQNFKLSYEKAESEETNIFGESEDKEVSRFDKITDEALRHIAVGAEAILGKNFYVSAGYDFRTGKEMTIDARSGAVGISWGFGLRVSRYRLSYGNKKQHLAGGTNFFTLNIDLDDFKNKNTKKDAPDNS